MIETQLSIFDAIILGIMMLSCLFAFFRGFVREVLSLGAWIGAGIATIYFFPSVAEELKPHFKNEIAAAGIGTLGIYIVSLIAFSILNRIIFKFVKSGSDVGALDNLLGLLFGALRGAFIVSLGYLLMMFAMGDGEKPDWLRQSVTRPYVEQGAQMLARAAPEYLHDISTMQKSASDAAAEDDSDGSYSHENTSQLDRLLENMKKEQDNGR